jgi:hypothetical protein
MKLIVIPIASAVLCALVGASASAQTPNGVEFQITKITRHLVATPQYTYGGAQPYNIDQRGRWLEVETVFAAAPEFTDELTFKYYILLNGKLLTGEVTHIHIPAGRELRSVMYVPPQTMTRLMGNRPVAETAVQNIAVLLVQAGAVKSELSLGRAAPRWYASLPAMPGFVLNKNETPFAPLYWDRYMQIKAAR